MEGVWDGGPSLCSQAPHGESPGTHLCFSLVDAHSLCLDLTVGSQSRPGQPWCEVQGSVDTKPFLQYDSDRSKVEPLGLLGEEIRAPCRSSCVVSAKQSDALVHPWTSASTDTQPSLTR
uniref:Uncharacterized protein n=1 Tax=Balaenoptera musculus TaxID=9771 RepID=A0A8C0HYS0_BALMU